MACPTPGSVARTIARIQSAIVATAAAVALALFVAAAVVGGGFGAKPVDPSGPLHGDEPLVMAHRGLREAHPENSRAALVAARAAGFGAVEIDVKRAADGRYYLFHDRGSKRLLNVDVELARLTLVELQRYPLYRDGRATDQRVLSLEAFATDFADDFVVFLDIKRHGDDDYRRLAGDIAGFLGEHGLERRSIVGGDFLFVTYFEFRFPSLHTALGGPGDLRAMSYRWIPVRFRPDFMIARLDEITPALVRRLRRNDLIDRWIVHGVDRDSLDRVEVMGFSKVLLD